MQKIEWWRIKKNSMWEAHTGLKINFLQKKMPIFMTGVIKIDKIFMTDIIKIQN